MSHTPLSTPLSHLLIAFTIEFDNEFERRFAETGVGRRFGVSMVMWSNFMRFVGDGITVGDLPVAAGLPKARVLSTLGGMERWRYVVVGPDAETKRDGWGSARGLRRDWIVRPTLAGGKAQEIWPPLFGDIERRWEERFGADEMRELQESLATVIGVLDAELPEYLPIVASANGMRADITHRRRQRDGAEGADHEPHLSALLAQALLAYTIDYERESEVSLPVSDNVLRVLDEMGLDVRDLPLRAGVSKEAVSMALRSLTKTGYVAGSTLVHLTPKGRETQEAARLLHAVTGQRWETTFGAGNVRRLRAAMQGVLDQRDGKRARLSLGLQPHPEGWRATRAYVEQTNAVLADPIGRLPHYPMVLHRGGWPDGS